MADAIENKLAPVHSSIFDLYGTPQEFFAKVNQEFGPFDLDVTAEPLTAKCPIWYGIQSDGSFVDAWKSQWFGRTFCNPPYSDVSRYALHQISELVGNHVDLSVGLVAARPDTQWFQALASYAGEIRFLKGRLKFEIVLAKEKRIELYEAVNYELNIVGGIVSEKLAKAVAAVAKYYHLPKTFVRANWYDTEKPVMESAPFPSALLIFDRRPKQTICFWDWKHNKKVSYYSPYDPSPFMEKADVKLAKALAMKVLSEKGLKKALSTSPVPLQGKLLIGGSYGEPS